MGRIAMDDGETARLVSLLGRYSSMAYPRSFFPIPIHLGFIVDFRQRQIRSCFPIGRDSGCLQAFAMPAVVLKSKLYLVKF